MKKRKTGRIKERFESYNSSIKRCLNHLEYNKDEQNKDEQTKNALISHSSWEFWAFHTIISPIRYGTISMERERERAFHWYARALWFCSIDRFPVKCTKHTIRKALNDKIRQISCGNFIENINLSSFFLCGAIFVCLCVCFVSSLFYFILVWSVRQIFIVCAMKWKWFNFVESMKHTHKTIRYMKCSNVKFRTRNIIFSIFSITQTTSIFMSRRSSNNTSITISTKTKCFDNRKWKSLKSFNGLWWYQCHTEYWLEITLESPQVEASSVENCTNKRASKCKYQPNCFGFWYAQCTPTQIHTHTHLIARTRIL